MKFFNSLIIILILSNTCLANDFIQLQEVKIGFMNFFPGGRDAMINNNGLTDKEPAQQLDLNINTNIYKWGYFNSLVHSLTDRDTITGASQFRLVGLNLELGVRINKYIDVFYWHYSSHLLDTKYYWGGYPLLDSVGVHIYLYRKNEQGSIF